MTESIDRKAAKRAYKETCRPMGVFQVSNTQSGKVMIASSPNLPAIFNRIRMQLNTGSYLKHPQLQKDSPTTSRLRSSRNSSRRILLDGTPSRTWLRCSR